MIRKSSFEETIDLSPRVPFIVDHEFLSSLSLENDKLTNNYAEMKEIKEKTRKSSRKLIAINQEFRKVFIKQLKPENLHLNQLISKSLSKYATLSHPNLVKLIDVVEEAGNTKIVTEFLEQANYFKTKLIEVVGIISLQKNMAPIKNELKLKSYLNDILEGLNYLHNQGYVHTDIRIEKLLCFDMGEGVRDVKIGGLELIRSQEEIISHQHAHYIIENHILPPPEICPGMNYSPKMDIWCLGVIFYRAYVGYPPSLYTEQWILKHIIFSSMKQLDRVFFRKQDWKYKDKVLSNLISQMLDCNPLNRPSASQILEKLEL